MIYVYYLFFLSCRPVYPKVDALAPPPTDKYRRNSWRLQFLCSVPTFFLSSPLILVTFTSERPYTPDPLSAISWKRAWKRRRDGRWDGVSSEYDDDNNNRSSFAGLHHSVGCCVLYHPFPRSPTVLFPWCKQKRKNTCMWE